MSIRLTRGSHFPGGITTSLVTSAGDLVLRCAAGHTVVNDPVVFDDFPLSVMVLATGAASPDVVNATIQGVVGSFYGFDGAATEERLTLKVEALHRYKEGEDIEMHLHVMPSTNDSGVAVFYFDYFYSRANTAAEAGGSLSVQIPISADTAYRDYTASLGLISGMPGATALKIGDFVIGTLRRTPAGVQDTYPADVLLKQVAPHCPQDTGGSRTRYAK